MLVKAPELTKHRKKIMQGLNARIDRVIGYSAAIDERCETIEEFLRKNEKDIQQIEKLFSQIDALIEKLGIQE